jgi:hypothetical protein
MRIQVSAANLDLSPVLRNYVEARVWVALRRLPRRPSWVGVRLIGDAGKTRRPPRVTCHVDVWLRGVGIVSVRHVDTNAYRGIDCAAVRLRQAITRRLRHAGLLAASPAARRRRHSRTISATSRTTAPPCLAVVIKPSGGRSRLGLRPWLRARYGIEEIQSITLSRDAWRQLASDESEEVAPTLTDRLALSLLCMPELVVVSGTGGRARSGDQLRISRAEVERVVRRIRSLRLSAEVVGVWTAERWDAAASLVESEEVGQAPAPGNAAAGNRADPCLPVFSGDVLQRLAERIWEDDGGRIESEPGAAGSMTHRRRGEVLRGAYSDRPTAPQGRFSSRRWSRNGSRRRARRDAWGRLFISRAGTRTFSERHPRQGPPKRRSS